MLSNKFFAPIKRTGQLMREVVTVNSQNNSVLFVPAKEVEFPFSAEVQECISTMKNTFFFLKSPYGLAANQLGFPWRVFLYYIPKEALSSRKDAEIEVPLSILINPVLSPCDEKDMVEDWEACFSVPEMQGKVARYNHIFYRGRDESGNVIAGKASGFLARIMQHEVDHLNGIVYTQKLKPGALYGKAEEMKEIEDSELKENISNYKNTI